MTEKTALEGRHYDDPEWLAGHLADERRRANVLGEIREVIFGAQDGVVSILTVVSTVGAATGETYPVLVAGLATTVAEVFSMAAGEYMSSKSQREAFAAQIAAEEAEVRERPEESRAEVAFMFEREGLERSRARRIAAEIATEPRVLLRTMVEKELGLIVDEGPGPLQGALLLSGALGIGALVPLLPYFFLPVGSALLLAVALSAAALFGIGVVKSAFTRRNPIVSGLQILLLGAVAGAGGQLVGTVLSGLMGGAAPR